MLSTIEDRLSDLGVTLPSPPKAAANYAPFVVAGSLLFVSGQLPMQEGAVVIKGKLGDGLGVDEGKQAARLCVINVLAQAKAALGDLERIVQCARLNGFVAAAPGFTDHPAVMNGASDLIAQALGERGSHSRIAVGCASLPMDAAVEVDAIFVIE